MRISVIIPAYNSARYLAGTIESVLRQSESDWELIIVDDGSSDQTLEIAREYAARDARIRCHSQANAGVASARNAGFALSDRSSRYICYLDNDDLWEPEALAALMAALEADPRAAGACGLPLSIDASDRPLARDTVQAYCRERFAVDGNKLVLQSDSAPTTFACFAVRNCIITPGLVMVRRDAHEKAGVHDETMSGCDDWDMWLRLCRYGYIVYLDLVVLRYRIHDSNLSRQHKTMDQRETLVYRKMFAFSEETPERRDLLRWGYRHRSRLMSGDRFRWAGNALHEGKAMEALRQLRHGLRMYWRFATGSLPR